MVSEHQLQYMADWEVKASAILGNRIARKIANGKTISANAAIRHTLATQGAFAAQTLAMELLSIDISDAIKHVARLMTTNPDDIVSPHWK